MPPRRRTPPRAQATHEPALYTYQGGQKIPLTKSPSEFIVRTSEEGLARLGVPGARRLSSASFRVRVAERELDGAMERARESATTHHAYYRAESGDEFLITDRVLVRYRDSASEEQRAALAGKYGLFLREKVSPRDYLYQLTDHTAMNPVKLVVELTEKEQSTVECADHDLNRVMELSALTLPTDPLYQREWHLHRSMQDPDFDPRASTRCEDAWQLLSSFGSADVVIGVTDDGCRLDHPDFSGDKFAGWGFFQGSTLFTDRSAGADPSGMFQAGANHGTSCCGVAAGSVNGQFTVGAAPGARLLPIKFESSGRSLLISDSKLLTALNYLADKVDIVSSSWAGAPSSVWAATVIERLQTLARTGGRRGKGILFLFAAGNWNCPIQHTGSVDIPFSSGWSFDAVGTPVWAGVRTSRSFRNNMVGIDGVLHIAAVSSGGARSHYSCYGEGIALSAPSSNSHMYQRAAVRGLGITATTGLAALTRPDFGGTSSATPLVAGVAALMVSANPALSAIEIAAILRRTASKDLDLASYPKTPPAVFDPNPAWDVSPVAPFDTGVFVDRSLEDGTWSPWFGHGRVDALAAVQEALSRLPVDAPVVTSASPDVLIPDNHAPGVTSRLVAAEPGRLSEIEVTVDIAHTWIGDLRVRLISPGGTEVVLHDRSGSNTRDLRATYTVQTLPALASFRGGPVAGAWRLVVQDLARLDEGRLRSWSLSIRSTPPPLVFADEAAEPIPDAAPVGITRQVILPAPLRGRELSVAVDISHAAMAELSVEMKAPNGAVILLAPLGALSGDSAVRVWKASENALLGQLLSGDLGGVWKLTLRDNAAGVSGKLNRWSIEVVK